MTNPASRPAREAPVVDTTAGAVRGLWGDDPEAPSAAFLGIPFAQPPTGELRFAAPVPVEPWTGIREATSFGATPQRGPVAEVTLIPEPSVPGDSTLNVNVYTPRPGDTAARLPVLVYIHGGGYVSGSPASPWYDGESFARDGVVTVVVSYRLGFDGFGLIDGAPSNRGVRDWLAALEWVQREIPAFGGDPDAVTIAGQSAGGGAVLTLLGMPAAQHLFQRVWSLSPALGDVSLARAENVAAQLAELAGVPATRDGFASVDPDVLIGLQQKVSERGGTRLSSIRGLLADGLPWGPMIDGDLLLTTTPESIASGVGADKALVIGSTDDEFTMITDDARTKLRFVPAAVALGALGMDRHTRRGYLADNAEQHRLGTAALLGRYVSDTVFRRGVARIAAARAAAPTWAYRFSWASTRIGWACHCIDVPFWFDVLDRDRVDALTGENPPETLADAVHGAASSFVRAGDPGWASWSEDPGRTRIFDVTGPETISDGYASVRALL
ncbi:MAG: carboxylesterase [Microbacterium sp. 67-17]|uniref:carboxylesterase/lipase family protein n=1 Tax=Microbacterium sp. 67-17 TaxID=1895782 RepID=UPI0009629273|nr:carboxylesterase family protein [Microbacterium sp. 67-17]OJW02501.1 MAG: carboxylesterase [Microbacterium sp. 67-17]